MRTKLLTSILLASTAIAGIASADPIVRDHRYQQPAITYRAPVRYQGQLTVQSRPSWMINANVNYGFQIDRDGDEVQPYTYGNDPYVEGIARGEWSLLADRLQFSGNQNQGKIMNLGNRPLSSVELQSEYGCSSIAKVVVTYADGTEMALKPGRDLDARRAPNLRVDLGAKGRIGVSRVIVYGTGVGVFRVLAA